MQQHAVPESSLPQDEEQDALRLQVEQIIAQRLERRNLMKSKPEAPEAEAPARPISLRKQPPETTPILDPLEEEFGSDPEPVPEASFAPLDDLPPLETPPETPERRKSDRRQAERRNMEFLRTELQWSTSDEEEEKRGLKNILSGFKKSRLVLLGVAVLSAAIAALLAVTATPPPPAPQPVAPVIAEPVKLPTARILVAASTIGAGERLDADTIAWHEMPLDDVLPEYVVEKANPEAIETANESIARYPFFPGDPIRTDKLLNQPQRSLATSLTPGMRGVSVVITPESAAGGFIKPDDYVDVVLVTNSGSRKTTRTILENVRIIALNTKLGPSLTGEANEDPTDATKIFEGPVRATLELDPRTSEVLVQAAANGALTLTLRPDQDASAEHADPQHGANQAIRLTSPFWTDAYSPAMQ